jgi:hypothetical protein
MPAINATVIGSLVLTAQTVTPSDGSVVNASVANSAGILATKLQQQYTKLYAQASATTASTITIPIHLVRGATCTLDSIKAGSVVANVGAATVTIDLKKNGTTVLSAVITLDNANTARVPEAGTITTAGGVADDLYELVITATAGGGTLATGLFVQVVINEDPR